MRLWIKALPLLALLALSCLGLNRGLWTPDEPREAEIGREMWLAPGLIPTLNGQRFIEKPPLYYWLMAGAYAVHGGPAVGAARAISVVAGLLTLALIYLWAQAAAGSEAALLSTAMLATAEQFLVSTHWVLLDPPMMFATTVAAASAWMRLARGGGARWLACLYGALIVALWLKGPIGPALIGAGLVLVIVIERPDTWRRLAPVTGLALLGASLGVLAFAIYRHGGAAALWEWGYVNHVQRLTHPGDTGHRQPALYYLWTLPVAMLPWLPALLESLRARHWRAARSEPLAADRYGLLMAAGMVGLLSLSATKRETYLLPVLPLLCLWLGVQWRTWIACGTGSRVGSRAQLLLVVLLCLAVPLGVARWQHALTTWTGAALLLALATCAYALARGWRAPPWTAPGGVLASALVADALVLWLAPRVLNDTKDMGPFMQTVGRTLPAGEPVNAVHVDETLAAEVPFYTGRRVLVVPAAELRAQALAGQALPAWVLVQDNDDGKDGQLPEVYRPVLRRDFGPHRHLVLWRRR